MLFLLTYHVSRVTVNFSGFNSHATLSPLNATDYLFFTLEDNGIEWKSLYEEKLNKAFDWDETFKAALSKGDEDALVQVKKHVLVLLHCRS